MNNNSKRIAKNTILLYIRMLVTMFVSLFTSRIILKTLGVTDYGIYNVVGGVVTMFSIISGSLSAASSRFITFELGKGNSTELKKIFSTSVNIQIIMSIIVIIFAEIIGVWFLNYKMNIPSDRLYAANWVFQFSILTFCINLISVPYNASIIAHEKMSAFAYISILEVSAKLAIVYLLYWSPIDKLIFYALLMAIVALIIRFVYGLFCKRNFTECRYQFIFDKTLIKKMFGFAGWNFIGNSSAIFRDQGGNILINLFCGPTVNAARGIAYQVNGAIHGFVGNFMLALNPQITKSYASGEWAYMMTLIFQGARLSYYMLLFLSLPVIINTHYILELWLGVVPEYTTTFVQLVLILAMSESISQPLITAQNATGRIKYYQISVGGLQLLNLPISYILLKNGCIPETVLIVAIMISQCCLFVRLYIERKSIQLPLKEFIQKVYINIIIVSISSAFIPLTLSHYMLENSINFIILCLLSIACTLISIYYIGCNKKEKKIITEKIKSLIHKLK